MRRPRGLTLIEVLVSIVLMTMLATVCMPLMRQSMRALDAPDPGFESHDLAALAEAFLAAPGAFGMNDDEIALGETTLDWPDNPDRPPVVVRRFERPPVPSADEGESEESSDAPEVIGGAWLVFECAPFTVCRWEPLAREEPAGDQPEEEAQP